MAEIVDVEFVGGPIDGEERSLDVVPLNHEHTDVANGFSQRHLYMLDVNDDSQFRYVYQGARARECAGR